MTDVQPISRILGLKSLGSVGELETAVAAGLPKRSVSRLAAHLYPDAREALRFRCSIVPLATWKRRTTRLSPEESERTERVARVLALAEYVWDEEETARRWMFAPHPELDGRAPTDAARTELGARRVEDLLNRLFYGLPV
jgi:putative toxin-antitoxin system antitoxin component (TIGR02293 family)